MPELLATCFTVRWGKPVAAASASVRTQRRSSTSVGPVILTGTSPSLSVQTTAFFYQTPAQLHRCLLLYVCRSDSALRYASSVKSLARGLRSCACSPAQPTAATQSEFRNTGIEHPWLRHTGGPAHLLPIGAKLSSTSAIRTTDSPTSGVATGLRRRT